MTFSVSQHTHKLTDLPCSHGAQPRCLGHSAGLDAKCKAGKVRGPLYGIPFIVKDNIASKDNMETTAGS
jgi:Asp-tRNA(Asn)/Glu-tRNA(Gln) amidotransferase A subunit family amidase